MGAMLTCDNSPALDERGTDKKSMKFVWRLLKQANQLKIKR